MTTCHEVFNHLQLIVRTMRLRAQLGHAALRLVEHSVQDKSLRLLDPEGLH
jgi:hypothetical protein